MDSASDIVTNPKIINNDRATDTKCETEDDEEEIIHEALLSSRRRFGIEL